MFFTRVGLLHRARDRKGKGWGGNHVKAQIVHTCEKMSPQSNTVTNLQNTPQTETLAECKQLLEKDMWKCLISGVQVCVCVCVIIPDGCGEHLFTHANKVFLPPCISRWCLQMVSTNKKKKNIRCTQRTSQARSLLVSLLL